jgi:hypothetical protein
MELTNHQKSELVVAKVLQYLLDRGLQPTELDEATLGLSDELQPFLPTCIQWLANEHLIHLESGSISRPDSIRLINPMVSAKGFSVLDAPFGPSSNNETVGDAVQKVSAGQSTYARAGNFAGGLLASFIKSMG